MRFSQNLHPLPAYTPLFNKFICATLPESTPPSQNIPPFNNYMRPSQNLPLPPRIYPPFQQLCAILPESPPPSQNIPRHSHKVPFPQRLLPSFLTTICPPPSLSEYIPRPLSTTVYDIPRIYPSATEYDPFSINYM